MKALLKLGLPFFLLSFIFISEAGHAQNVDLKCTDARSIYDLKGEPSFILEVNDLSDGTPVCFINGENTVIELSGPINTSADLIFDQSCKNTAIKRLDFESGVPIITTIISEGELTIDELIVAKAHEIEVYDGLSLGLAVRGSGAFFSINVINYESQTESGLNIIEATEGSTFYSKDVLVLSGPNSQFYVESGANLRAEKEITVDGFGSEFEIREATANIALDLSLPQSNGNITFYKSDVIVGQNLVMGQSGVITLWDSDISVGANLQLLLGASIRTFPGANLTIEEMLIVPIGTTGLPPVQFIPVNEQLYCAKVTAKLGVNDPNTPIGDNSEIKLCDWPVTAFNPGSAEVITGTCPDCTIPAFDETTIANVNVGEVITITGKGFKNNMDLILGSTENQDFSPSIPYTFVSENEILVEVPLMPEFDSFKLNDENISVNVQLAPIVITSVSESLVNAGDLVWLYGSNLKFVNRVSYFSKEGVEIEINTGLTNTSSDSIGFIAPSDLFCHTSISVTRTFVDSESTESTQYSNGDNYFESPSTVTNSNVSGIGSFEYIMNNVCDNAVITFDPNLDTIAYDYISFIDNPDSGPAKNITIRGNGKTSTILVDSNAYEGGFYLSGVENYLFEDLSFQNTVDSSYMEPYGVFLIRSGDFNTSLLSTVTFSNVEFKNNSSLLGAGAINVFDGSTITIDRCSFTNNTSDYNGGAIYANSARVDIESGSIFSKNVATLNGGAIYTTSAIYINVANTVFSQNEAQDGGAISSDLIENMSVNNSFFIGNHSSLRGGALDLNTSSFSDAQIYGTTFQNNSSDSIGGAIYCENLAMQIDSCSINGNTANDYGGGLFLHTPSSFVTIDIIKSLLENNSAINFDGGAIYATNNRSFIDLNRSTIMSNSARNGGGAYARGVESQSCTWYNNTATNEGGALYVEDAELSVLNSTIYKNTSQNGGAVSLNGGALVSLKNNAIGENTSSLRNSDILGLNTISEELTLRSNCFTDTTGFGYFEGKNTNVVVHLKHLYLNPIPQTSGLQTYFLPYSFSPLINNVASGTSEFEQEIFITDRPSVLIADESQELDQLGYEFQIGDLRDIGAVELLAVNDPMHVTTIVDDEMTEGSIRSALIYYNYHYPADTMTFDAAVVGRTILLDSTLAFELRLNPANDLDVSGLPINRDKFLYSNGTGVTLSPESSTISQNDGMLDAKTKLLFSGFTIDGFNTVNINENYSDNGIDLTEGAEGSILDNIIIKNFDLALEVKTGEFELSNSFIYSNTTGGVKIESEITNPAINLMNIHNNVIGLDENLQTLDDSFNHQAAGVIFVSGLAVLGGNSINDGNIIAGNEGAGLVIGGYENDIVGNFIGILKDSTTIIPNKRSGIEFFSGDTSGVFNNIDSNIIAGSPVGILIPSSFQGATGIIYENNFYKNLFIANDTAIQIQDIYQGGIKAPSDIVIKDSVITGNAEPFAEIQIYMDSTDNASAFIDTVSADNLGEFSYDLKNNSNLPSFEYVTTLQTLSSKGSSELSEPAFVDCEQFDDLLVFSDTTDIGLFLKALPKICGDTGSTFTTDIELSSPYLDNKAEYQWFNVTLSSITGPMAPITIATRDSIIGQNDDTLKMNFPNGILKNLGLAMRLENGCVIESNNVIQEVTFPESLNFAFNGSYCVDENDTAYVEIFGGSDSTFVYYSYKGIQTADTLSGMSTGDPIIVPNITSIDTFFIDSARTFSGCEVFFATEEEKQLVIKLNPTIEPIDPQGSCDSLIVMKELFVYDTLLSVSFFTDAGNIEPDSIINVKQNSPLNVNANLQDEECFNYSEVSFMYFPAPQVSLAEDTLCIYGKDSLETSFVSSDSVRMYYTFNGITGDTLLLSGENILKFKVEDSVQTFKVDSIVGEYCLGNITLGNSTDSTLRILPSPSFSMISEQCDSTILIAEDAFEFENSLSTDYEYYLDFTTLSVFLDETIPLTINTDPSGFVNVSIGYTGQCINDGAGAQNSIVYRGGYEPLVTTKNVTCEGGNDGFIKIDTVNQWNPYVTHSWEYTGTNIVDADSVTNLSRDTVSLISAAGSRCIDTLEFIISETNILLTEIDVQPFVECENKDSVWLAIKAYDPLSTYQWSVVNGAATVVDNTRSDSILYNMTGLGVVTFGLSETTPEGCSKTVDSIVTPLNCEIVLAPVIDRDSLCLGDSSFFSHSSTGVVPGDTVRWEIGGVTYEESSPDVLFTTSGDNFITLTIIPVLDPSKQKDTTFTVFVKDRNGLDSYELTLDNSIDGEVVSMPGDTIFTCTNVTYSFESNEDNIIIWSSTSDDTLRDAGFNYYSIYDEDMICGFSDSIFVRVNTDVSNNIIINANTGTLVVDTLDIRTASPIAEIDTVVIVSTGLQYGEAEVVEDLEGNVTIEYTSNSELVGVKDLILLDVTDVCGVTRNVPYEIELINSPPVLTDIIINQNVIIEEVISREDSVIVITSLISSDPNNNISSINILNELEYPYLKFSVIEENGRPLSVKIKVLSDSITDDQIKNVEIEFNVCDTEGACSEDGLMRIGTNFETGSDKKVENNVLQLNERNKIIRDSLDISVINSAVTNNVGLRFEFTWNNKKIDVSNLEYELIIISRWGDVVYQDFVQGENVNWNGEYQDRGSQEKIGEGNYQWVVRARYVNDKGNERFRNVSGNLYYVNIDSQNIPD